MSEPRRLTVQQDNPVWQEYDREVLLELWHNQNQATALRLSREEATRLKDMLEAFLAGDA